MAVTDSYIQGPVDGVGKKVDTTAVTTGAGAVERESVSIADPEFAARRAGVTAAGALQTDASATTQPVSAAILPLPTGAATGAKQDTGNASLSSIDGKTP